MNKKKVAGDAIWADLDNNGVIDDKDIAFIGWANPDKKGALINNLSYKNFSLRLVVDFALGHSIANIWRCRANANARNAIITTTDVTMETSGGRRVMLQQPSIRVTMLLLTGITDIAITCVQ